MEITIKIPDELAARAPLAGARLEDYIERLLTQHLALQPTEKQPLRTATEIRSWLDSLAQFSDKIPPLPETISREWFYSGHE